MLVFASPRPVGSLTGLALPLRVAITLLLLAPMGLLLGIPLAYGVRILDARSTGFAPLGMGDQRLLQRDRLDSQRHPLDKLRIRHSARGLGGDLPRRLLRATRRSRSERIRLARPIA